MGPIKFDLNIGTILKDWTAPHAVREIIANALDEELLQPGVPPSEITHNPVTNVVTVRDFGRGIKVDDFILNEDATKRDNVRLMGKFGFELKDAIATLYRLDVHVRVHSPYCDLQVETAAKTGVDAVESLHMVGLAGEPAVAVAAGDATDMPLPTPSVGTVVTLSPISAKDFAAAQSYLSACKTQHASVRRRLATCTSAHVTSPRASFSTAFKLPPKTTACSTTTSCQRRGCATT